MRRSSSRDRLLQTLSDLVKSLQRNPPFGETSEDIQRPASRVPCVDITTFPDEPGEACASSGRNADDLMTLENHCNDPVAPTLPSTEESPFVTFPDLVVTNVVEPNRPEATESEPQGLIQELFKEQSQPPSATSWLPIILNTLKTEARSGLTEELRTSLLAKYEPKTDLSFLGSPRLNKEILPNLDATVLARDHQGNIR